MKCKIIKHLRFYGKTISYMYDKTLQNSPKATGKMDQRKIGEYDRRAKNSTDKPCKTCEPRNFRDKKWFCSQLVDQNTCRSIFENATQLSWRRL